MRDFSAWGTGCACVERGEGVRVLSTWGGDELRLYGEWGGCSVHMCAGN